MNIKGFIQIFAFSLVLLGLSVTANNSVLNYVLAAILFLFSLVILFENVSKRKHWKDIVKSAKDLDLTYVAFGLTMINVGIKILNISSWAGLMLTFGGVISAGVGIGKLIGTGGRKILDTNARFGIILGFIFIIGAIIFVVLTWKAIIEKTITA